MKKEDIKVGMKVKIPTHSTEADIDSLNRELRAAAYTKDYLIYVGDYLTFAELNINNSKNTLANCLFNYDELKPYEEPEVVVNNINPEHYQQGGVQVIDQMIELYGVEKVKAFCEVNAYKYFSRAGKKAGNSVEQDLAKAAWYINKLKELTDG